METVEQKSEHRQRKKKLINEVKNLLEFYFSPANLGKDYFMQDLLNEDPFIDLDIFFKFNKLRSYTNDPKILRKAIKKSDILKLSEDGSKVQRTAPVEMKEDELECTIYVENLPPNSTHDWIRKVFSLYGAIDYISLPRFYQTGRPKGFAFIEFHTPQEARKALEAFGGLASLDGTLNPAELLSIRTFKQTGENFEDTELPSSDLTQEDETAQGESPETQSQQESVSSVQESEEPPTKKMKLSKDEEQECSKSKKKKRKRNKKGKVYEPDSVYLRVMSKKEWKVLRNSYLNLQRENKALLRNTFSYSYDLPNPQLNSTIASTKMPQFIPGVIVKIVLNDPPQNIKEFREELCSGRPDISYIDLGKEQNVVYIRFKSSDGSNQFLEEKLYDTAELLSGKEEKKYWDKIIISWQEKRQKKSKV